MAYFLNIHLNLTGTLRCFKNQKMCSLLVHLGTFWVELQQALSNDKELKITNNEVNAAPLQTQVQEDGYNVWCNIFIHLCSAMCKKTLAEVLPPPTRNVPLNAVITKELHLEGFSKDVCRGMVAMLDIDRSGKLGFEEFKQLWNCIRTWKNAWVIYDTDKSGSFNGFELRDALNIAGYKLNTRVLNVLMHRYGNRKGQIHFDDFMMCAIKVKTMIDIFKAKDDSGANTASFTMEEWLETTLYA